MITKIHEFERKGVKNEVYRITNENGAELDILTYGARMIRLTAPDKNGNMGDVLVGYAKLMDPAATQLENTDQSLKSTMTNFG